MATFSTKKILYGSTSLIPTIAKRIQDEFQFEGYEVTMDVLSSGGYDISITKGGLFKTILGMKTALKVTLIPQGGNIYLDAGIGIWGQQAVHAVISMLYFWPLLVTQLWGMVEQSKLDDKVLDIAQNVISMEANQKQETMDAGKSKFCPYCGTENPADAKFCIRDGQRLH